MILRWSGSRTHDVETVFRAYAWMGVPPGTGAGVAAGTVGRGPLRICRDHGRTHLYVEDPRFPRNCHAGGVTADR